MIVLHLTDCPISLRGDLTKWLLEIASGVFVGQVSTRVRDELWSRVKEHCRNGRAVLVFNTNGEQQLDFHVHGDTWEPIDFDGIKLMLRPSSKRLKSRINDAQSKKSSGFSNASKRRDAKRFSDTRSRCPENYIIIDLETTGLNPEVDEIIEIGAIKMTGHVCADIFSSLVLTEKPISSSVLSLTGITNEMIKDTGAPLYDVLLRLSSFLGSLPIVGHNIDFDRSFLLNSCAKCGLPLIVNRCVDTMNLARKLVKDVENHKLNTLAERFGIDQTRSHRSISDCETTGRLYRKLINLIDSDPENAVF